MDMQVPIRDSVHGHEAAHALAAASLFIAVYLGSFLTLAFAAAALGVRNSYWLGVVSASLATWFTVRTVERGVWPIGFFVPPRLAAREFLGGVLVASGVVGLCDALILSTTALHHAPGSRFPWIDLVVIFVPAALHEEVLFRGYVFQRVRAWNRGAAVAATSLVFALLHGRNEGITAIAFANLALAGVLLALAYEHYGRLWFPIGIHLAWNVLSGPVLGYDVSGYAVGSSLLRTVGAAPPWLSGGTFGIEGSAMMTAVEIVAIFALSVRGAGRVSP